MRALVMDAAVLGAVALVNARWTICPLARLAYAVLDETEVPPAVGIELTESCAMWPAASVSGIYLSHPQAKYFNVGRVGRDQAEAYARRKGWAWADVEKWLASE